MFVYVCLVDFEFDSCKNLNVQPSFQEPSWCLYIVYLIDIKGQFHSFSTSILFHYMYMNAMKRPSSSLGGFFSYVTWRSFFQLQAKTYFNIRTTERQLLTFIYMHSANQTHMRKVENWWSHPLSLLSHAAKKTANLDHLRKFCTFACGNWQLIYFALTCIWW